MELDFLDVIDNAQWSYQALEMLSPVVSLCTPRVFLIDTRLAGFLKRL